MFGRFACYALETERSLEMVTQLVGIAATIETLPQPQGRWVRNVKFVDIILPVGENIDVVRECTRAGGFDNV